MAETKPASDRFAQYSFVSGPLDSWYHHYRGVIVHFIDILLVLLCVFPGKVALRYFEGTSRQLYANIFLFIEYVQALRLSCTLNEIGYKTN